MDANTATALANEARRQAAKQAISDLQGRINNASSLVTIISSTITDAQQSLAAKQSELAAIESGAGAGVTDDWGSRVDFVTVFIRKLVSLNLITADQQTTFLQVLDGTYTAG